MAFLGPNELSVIERCPYYRGVRKERLDCTFKTNSELSKGLFTRKEGYPFARVTLTSGFFTCRVTLSPESTLQALLTCSVMRDIFRNSPNLEIILNFSMENALNSQKRDSIIIVDRT